MQSYWFSVPPWKCLQENWEEKCKILLRFKNKVKRRLFIPFKIDEMTIWTEWFCLIIINQNVTEIEPLLSLKPLLTHATCNMQSLGLELEFVFFVFLFKWTVFWQLLLSPYLGHLPPFSARNEIDATVLLRRLSHRALRTCSAKWI